MKLPGYTYKPADFTVTDVKRNTCAGCWFAEHSAVKCYDARAWEFVKEIFSPGSCGHKIAELKIKK